MVISTSKGRLCIEAKGRCGNRTFEILKFRTMVVDAENLGGPSTALEIADHVHRQIFAREQADELPQLLNVIKGEMSWSGHDPRFSITRTSMRVRRR